MTLWLFFCIFTGAVALGMGWQIGIRFIVWLGAFVVREIDRRLRF